MGFNGPPNSATPWQPPQGYLESNTRTTGPWGMGAQVWSTSSLRGLARTKGEFWGMVEKQTVLRSAMVHGSWGGRVTPDAPGPLRLTAIQISGPQLRASGWCRCVGTNRLSENHI